MSAGEAVGTDQAVGPAAEATGRGPRVVDTVVAAGFAVAGLVVVLTPAVVAQWGVLDAGIGSLDDDFVATSALVGTAHVVAAWSRLQYHERMRWHRAHVWIASLNGLVVLALSASLLGLSVLYLLPDERVPLASRGFPVVAMWAAAQVVAVVLAELTARRLLRWLEPTDRRPVARAGH